MGLGLLRFAFDRKCNIIQALWYLPCSWNNAQVFPPNWPQRGTVLRSSHTHVDSGQYTGECGRKPTVYSSTHCSTCTLYSSACASTQLPAAAVSTKAEEGFRLDRPSRFSQFGNGKPPNISFLSLYQTALWQGAAEEKKQVIQTV